MSWGSRTRMGMAIESVSLDLARLVERSRAGDRDAQGQLVSEMQGAVRAVAWRALRNEADVEDLCQNIYLAVFRGLRSFRGEAQFRTWVTVVARNEARKFLRTRQRREQPVQDADREPDRLPGRPEADRLERQQVHWALGQLPAAERMALEAVVFDGQSYDQAGRHLGCTAAAVRGRVYRARRELRRLLAKTES